MGVVGRVARGRRGSGDGQRKRLYGSLRSQDQGVFDHASSSSVVFLVAYGFHSRVLCERAYGGVS